MKRKLVLAILLILIFALSAMVAYGSTPADHLRVNGIDISPFNGEIDWDKAKADGVEFAFIRIGGQYYGEKGGHYFDDSLKANYDGAKSSDIIVGGYFFSQAITVEEAIKEAEESHNYIIENGINPSDFELPFFIDRELISDDDGPGRLKVANLSVEQELEIELAFCNRLRELGYESGLYSYLNFLNNNTDSTVLSDLGYPIWVAQYYDECEYEHIYNLWQFTESGTVDGIGVPTDCD